MSQVLRDQALSDIRSGFLESNAEREEQQLPSYFVYTDAWRELFAGHGDIVCGYKGSGKSALYSLLVQNATNRHVEGQTINEDRIIVQAGEPLTSTSFRNVLEKLIQDPTRHSHDSPITETEFRYVWELFFLALTGNHLQQAFKGRKDIQRNEKFRQLSDLLKRHGLLNPSSQAGLGDLLESVMKKIKFNIGGGVPLGPILVGGGIELPAEDSIAPANSSPLPPGKFDKVIELINSLIAVIKEILESTKNVVWIAVDRLDDTFSYQNKELEAEGMRGLLLAVLDFQPRLSRVKIKLFLRGDYVRRVLERGGFAGLGKVGTKILLQWRDEELLDLAVRRLIQSQSIRDLYNIRDSDIEIYRNTYSKQEALFHEIFPSDVASTRTFPWLLDQLRDGRGDVAPRLLVQIIHKSAEIQIRSRREATTPHLFSEDTVREAVKQITQSYYDETFKGEFWDLSKFTDALRNLRQEYSIGALRRIWAEHQRNRYTLADARAKAADLRTIGFFGLCSNGKKDDPDCYAIPLLYKAPLHLKDGFVPG